MCSAPKIQEVILGSAVSRIKHVSIEHDLFLGTRICTHQCRLLLHVWRKTKKSLAKTAFSWPTDTGRTWCPATGYTGNYSMPMCMWISNLRCTRLCNFCWDFMISCALHQNGKRKNTHTHQKKTNVRSTIHLQLPQDNLPICLPSNIKTGASKGSIYTIWIHLDIYLVCSSFLSYVWLAKNREN
jgi:hypothetical protein